MKLLRYLLLPFAIIYGGITIFRNWLFNNTILKPSEFSIPIINVGNLSMGGTGKTPHVEYIARLLSKTQKIAILSRGYGRKTSDYLEAKIDHLTFDIGDEPLQFKTKFPEITVAVDKRRVKGVLNLLYDHPNTESIILDDAFQHRSIKSGLNILLTKYSNPYFNDQIFPIGSLRELKKGASRADIIIITKCQQNISEDEKLAFTKQISLDIPVFFTKIIYKKVYSIFDHSQIDLTPDLNILLITGIANTIELTQELKHRNLLFKHLSYRDHYPFNEKDGINISEIFNKFADQNKIILTTEKDAMRLKNIKELSNLPIYAIEIQIDFLEKKDSFDKQIMDYARFNKKDN